MGVWNGKSRVKARCGMEPARSMNFVASDRFRGKASDTAQLFAVLQLVCASQPAPRTCQWKRSSPQGPALQLAGGSRFRSSSSAS